MSDDKAKIISRIKKLLAMAGDVSSPNEAAIAASRARKLMDEYQVTLGDIQESDGFGSVAAGKRYRFQPIWIQILEPAIADFNDCQVISADGRVVFRGIETDVFLAVSMYEYLITTITRLCKEYMREQGYKHYFASIGDPFKHQASSAVVKRLKQMALERKVATPTGKDLIVVKQALVEEKFGVVKYGKVRKGINVSDPHVAHAVMAGREAGENIPLNTQVNREPETRRLK